jgi:hypothetical protein
MLGFILFNVIIIAMAYAMYVMDKCAREEKIERNRERNRERHKPEWTDYSI